MMIKISLPIAKPEPSIEPLLYTRKETARILGILVRTLDSLTQDGEILCTRIGRSGGKRKRVFYTKESVQKYIQEKTAFREKAAN